MKYIHKKCLVYIVILIFSTLFVGCLKNKLENIETDLQLINPMEYVGIEHNKFMKEFTSTLEESYKNKNWAEIDFLSDNYVTQFSSVMSESYHKCYKLSTSTVAYQKNIYEQLDLNEWFDNDNVTSLNLAESVMSRGTFLKSARSNLKNKTSNKDKKFTSNLLQDIYNTSSKEYNSEEEAYIALEEVINKHEKLILSQVWTSEDIYVLGALAVAKYSVQFWKNYDFSVFENPKLVIRSYRAKREYHRPPSYRSSFVVGADIAGYVIGGVVGVTSGSLFGPAGTIGGFLGGKALGVWGASGAAATAMAIYDHWSDFFSMISMDTTERDVEESYPSDY